MNELPNIIIDDHAPRDTAAIVDLSRVVICERCWKLLAKGEDVLISVCLLDVGHSTRRRSILLAADLPETRRLYGPWGYFTSFASYACGDLTSEILAHKRARQAEHDRRRAAWWASLTRTQRFHHTNRRRRARARTKISDMRANVALKIAPWLDERDW